MEQEVHTPSSKVEIDRIDRTPSFRIETEQHVRLLEVNQAQGRVICECWNCKQGLLIQHEREPQQEIKVTCPNCSRIGIKLQVAKILSVTAIQSPWSD